MRQEASFISINKTVVGLIVISLFLLSTSHVYAESYSATSDVRDDPSLSNTTPYSKVPITHGLAQDSSLNAAFAMNDNPRFSESETNYTSKNYTNHYSGAGASAKDWSFSFAPYLWLVGINGTIGAKGQTADIDISFGDIWDNLDFAFQGHAEILYRSKYGFFVDATYIKLSTKNVRGPFNIKATMKMNMWEFVGFYRFFEQPSGFKNSKGQPKPSFYADVLGGGRLMNIDNTINFGGTGPIGASNQISGTETWFDFLVGARIKWQIVNRIFFASRTDIGGFGLGFSSDFSWNFIGMLGVDATDWMQILLGYRVFYDDYSDGTGNNRFVYDAWMTGPIVGINFVY